MSMALYGIVGANPGVMFVIARVTGTGGALSVREKPSVVLPTSAAPEWRTGTKAPLRGAAGTVLVPGPDGPRAGTQNGVPGP